MLGVDGEIHRAAGPDLLAACRQVKATNGIRCPFGEARITAAGKLTAKYVIHTVGPIYTKEKNPEAVLEAAYSNSLDLALAHKCSTIALPAISCGAYGYPIKDAALVAFTVCIRAAYSRLDICFYLFGKHTFHIWQKALESFSS